MATSDTAAASAERFTALKVIAALLLALKLASLLYTNVFTDEAYYWMWGQHPALSYYDHPPLNAWLQGLAHAVFGRSVFALRFWNLLTLAGTIWIFLDWSKRFAGEAWRGVFWRGVVVYLATPAFGAYGTVGTGDHLMLFFCLAAGHFLLRYLEAVRETGSGRLSHFYLGALLLGIAGLAKYNAVFLGLGLGAYIVFSPRLRPLLRSPHLYLAALLSVAVVSPVLIWNAQHGFASFSFHLVERHGAAFLSRIDLDGLIEFAIVTVAALGPFLIYGMLRFLAARPQTPFEATARGLALWTFWLSSLTFIFFALTDQAYFWWNIAAYILPMPFMGRYMANRFVFWGHVTLSAAFSLFYVISASIFPLLLLFGYADSTRTRYYGWQEIAQPLNAAIAALHPDFVGSSKWEYASLAGFALDRPDIVALNPRPDQYHYWFDREAHRGQNAVLFAHNVNEEYPAVAGQFDRITLYREIPVVRFGHLMGTYRIYYAEGYRPSY